MGCDFRALAWQVQGSGFKPQCGHQEHPGWSFLKTKLWPASCRVSPKETGRHRPESLPGKCPQLQNA